MFVPCLECPLRRKPAFRPFSEIELDFIGNTKADHVVASPGADIIREGEVGGPLYTLFEGWAVRYQTFPDRGRQILDIVLPGDTVGLQGALLGTIAHSVQAVTPATFCVLPAGNMAELFHHHPGLAIALMRARMEEEQRADLRLALLGRYRAPQRIAYLMLETFDRLRHRGLVDGGSTCPFPLQRRHLADAAGLSRVHVARSLDELRRAGLADIQDGVLVLFDRTRLAEFARYVRPRAASGRALL